MKATIALPHTTPLLSYVLVATPQSAANANPAPLARCLVSGTGRAGRRHRTHIPRIVPRSRVDGVGEYIEIPVLRVQLGTPELGPSVIDTKPRNSGYGGFLGIARIRES